MTTGQSVLALIAAATFLLCWLIALWARTKGRAVRRQIAELFTSAGLTNVREVWVGGPGAAGELRGARVVMNFNPPRGQWPARLVAKASLPFPASLSFQLPYYVGGSKRPRKWLIGAPLIELREFSELYVRGDRNLAEELVAAGPFASRINENIEYPGDLVTISPRGARVVRMLDANVVEPKRGYSWKPEPGAFGEVVQQELRLLAGFAEKLGR